MTTCRDILTSILNKIGTGFGVLDSTNTQINPAKEDGNLLAIKEKTDEFIVNNGKLEVDIGGATVVIDESTLAKDSSVQSVLTALSLFNLTAHEPFSGSATVTHTFGSNMNGFAIKNDGTTDLTFTIGSDTYTVKAGESFIENFGTFISVTVTTTSPFRAYGLGV